MTRNKRKIIWIILCCILLVIAGYFLLDRYINKKITEALKQLPNGIELSYSSLHTSILNSSVVIDDAVIKYSPEKNNQHQHELQFGKISLNGIHFFKILSKKLIINNVALDSGKITLDQYLLDKNIRLPETQSPVESLSIGELKLNDMNASVREGENEHARAEGSIIVNDIRIDSLDKSFNKNNFHFEGLRCFGRTIKYIIPGSYESAHIKGLELDTKKSTLHVDTCKIVPALSKTKMGEKIGHQVDYIEGSSSGIDVENLDVMQLLDKKIIADKVTIRQNKYYAFRDRRLPLDTSTKPLPVDYFKTMPFNIRIKHISTGVTNFEYEEFPKDGKETGVLKIVRLNISISPFISHPVKGDPEYMNMKVVGSLMGSGTVSASMEFPLQKTNPYKVTGAFNELDLTTLNASAENLGKIRIESGMLNSLSFEFTLNKEKSVGKIIGEYHNLVIDKLKEKSDDKKVDKFKSFFLKHLIIPKNKDKTLDVSKRTGKVDYDHDPQRYFSYYLLHSLLMGVKSSFSLGFLLPG